MAKVTNLTDRGIPLRGWRVLPKSSKIVDRMGHLHDVMPDADAYCAQAKRLADQGVLELEGYGVKKAAPKVIEAKPVVKAEAEVKVAVEDKPKVEDKVSVKPKKRRRGSKE